MPKDFVCNCTRYCAGRKNVSASTFYSHRQFRSVPTPANPIATTPTNNESSNCDGSRGNQIIQVPQCYEDPVNLGEEPRENTSTTQHLQIDIRSLREDVGLAFPSGNTQPDPGSLITDTDNNVDNETDNSNMDLPEDAADASNSIPLPPPPQVVQIDPLVDVAFKSKIEDIQCSLDFIRVLQQASLETCGLKEEDIERIRNPPQDILELDPLELFSLRQFLACRNAPQQTYTNIRENHNTFFPESVMLSANQLKRCMKEWSGVVPVIKDICPNSCVAYTGPFEKREVCPNCDASRWNLAQLAASDGRTKIPARQFQTFPIGPQIQALFRHERMAKEFKYRSMKTNIILEELYKSQGVLSAYDDFFTGFEYLNAIRENKINVNDILLMFSMDGAQLYEHKQSDCWIAIFTILDLRPEIRYKKKYVLPACVIPGPNNPANMDSFLFPTFSHLSAIQKEGLTIWDASTTRSFTSNLFFFISSADGPGSVYLSGLVGHQGACPCRLFCGIKGRHKPGIGCYYPALLKPSGSVPAGCSHPDIEVTSVGYSSSRDYNEKLNYIMSSPTIPEYRNRRKQTGIVKPSLLNGLDPRYRLPVVSTFTGDAMHVTTLNMGDLLIPLWRGTFSCDSSDSIQTWPWVILRGTVWKEHGLAVATSRPFIPGSFDRPPRNIAEKVNSGYKAKEWQHYLYGLAPALLYGLLPLEYWQNFCKLVFAIRILHQRSISSEQLKLAQEKLDEFHTEFELIYVQRRLDRIHFMRPCMHLLLHLGLDVPRISPCGLHSTWTMERTIGNLGQELRLHSNPFANLSERALLRAQTNVLETMIPGLHEAGPTIPRGAIDLGDGYNLLCAHERTSREHDGDTARAIHEYFRESVSPQKYRLSRWSRLRLPTGQIARSLWKESLKSLDHLRIARMVKFLLNGKYEFAEVHFYFQMRDSSGKLHNLALTQLFSPPDLNLYEKSMKTVYSTIKLNMLDGLQVIDVKSICSVVSMQPHTLNGENRFFVWEKFGLDVMICSEVEEYIAEED